MDAPTFISASSTPHEIRLLPGILSRIDQPSARAVLSWALKYTKLTHGSQESETPQALELSYQELVKEILKKDKDGVFATSAVPTTGFRRKKTGPLVEENVSALCAGVFLMLKTAIKARVDPRHISAELTELRFPETFISDFGSLLQKNMVGLRKLAEMNDISLPTLKKMDWRVDVAISDTSMMKVLKPSVTTKMELSDGKIETTEMSVEMFQQLRYAVASALQNVEHVEKLPILRIDERLERARSVKR